MQWRYGLLLILRTSSLHFDGGIVRHDASLLQLRMVHRGMTTDQVGSEAGASEEFRQVLDGRKQRERKKKKVTSARVRPKKAGRKCLKKEKKKCNEFIKRKFEKRACSNAAISKCTGESTQSQVTVETARSSGCAKEFTFEAHARPVCLQELEDLPEAWLPSEKLRALYENNRWTHADQKLANESVRVALDEMVDYQAEHPETIKALWADSVEPYLDFAFDAENMPKMRDRALAAAVDRLLVVAAPYSKPEAGAGECADSDNLLQLAIYAHNLGERSSDAEKLLELRDTLTLRTNEAINDCGTFSKFLGYDPEDYFSLARMGSGKIYDMLMWVVLFLDAMAIPNLELPREAKPFVTRFWRYLAAYPKPAAKSFSDGADNSLFFDLAYLMTHAGFVPTGYGRYELCISDGPWLYEFLRENFYAVLERSDLDLISEFLDLFRQYGCTEDNDKQLRDGARYLLDAYKKAGRSWMNYRESYERGRLKPYDLMHKPWTAGAGLRRRIFELVGPKSYGQHARHLLND